MFFTALCIKSKVCLALGFAVKSEKLKEKPKSIPEVSRFVSYSGILQEAL